MREDKLLQILKKKKGFFEAILDLTENEDHYSMSDLISILEQKQVLLSCIEELDQQLLPYKQSLHSLSQEISDELDSIRKVVERILHHDTLNQEKRKKEWPMFDRKKC